MPEASVIIPAFNAAKTLGSTLASVLGQTFDDLEVVVVDDGSTDDTAAIAAAIGPPVACISTENRGVAAARNSGLDQASGQYVAFLDADDRWEPRKLQHQIELLSSRPEIGACFTATRRVDDEDRTVAYTPARDYADFCETLLLKSMVFSGASSALVRREVASKLGGFDPCFSQCADWDYFIRLSLCARLAPIDEPLVVYRCAAGNMSSDVGLLERDTFAVLDKFFASSDGEAYRYLRQRCYSNHWMIVSGSYLHAGQPRDALRCLREGFHADPGNLRRPLGLPARWARRLRRGRARSLTSTGG